MKYFLNIILLIFIFAVSGCTADNEIPAPVDYDFDKISERGKLVAITGFNAYSYFIYKGQPMGFEYELLTRLADYLGVKIDIRVERELPRMFKMLNSGDGDLIAFNLTVTNQRKKRVKFTNYYYTTRQVLVQKKPDNWRKMKIHQIEKTLIRNPIDLDGRTVYVRKGSSFVQRLKNLSDEIGGKINIIEMPAEFSEGDLMEMVSEGDIDFTVADETVARITGARFQNLDINTKLSLPQKIAWAVRKNADSLRTVINDWLAMMKKTPDYYEIYNRYFKNKRAFRARVKSDYFSLTGGKISVYDDLIREYAEQLGWDWRLLASLIYQESQFDPEAVSWAGAQGLMQLMPVTAAQFGVKDRTDPHESLRAGVKYLKYLNKFWADSITSADERIDFVLASYNIGPSHIIDARNLAVKYGGDPNLWKDNVEYYLRRKSDPKYYNDPVVQFGYASGEETVEYVEEVVQRYEQYKHFIE